MNSTADQRFVDHPAPSVGLVSIFLGCIGLLVVAIPNLSEIPKGELTAPDVIGLYGILAFSIGILCFYMWPLYTTYYVADKTGITVKYGPWTHVSRWEDFKTVYWQKGMFLMRIGWPSINPCVRLSNGLVLPRKNRRWGLYLTPNDPRAFIEKITLFAPELTKEMML
jgi:hypothetical protein